MVSRARQRQTALFGRVAQHDPTVFGIAGAGMEHSGSKNSRLARIIRIGLCARLIRDHFRGDHERGRPVKERYTVEDGCHVPIGKRDQPPGCDQYLFAGRRLPEDLPVKRAGLHVEPPIVAHKVGIGEPEGLVIDEELDDLAVSHAEDGLACFREAVSVFWVDDRAGFIKSIYQSCVFNIGPAFLGTSAHAEVPVAKRQHGFQLSQEFGVEPFFYDAPFVGWEIAGWRSEGYMMDHRAVSSPGRTGQSRRRTARRASPTTSEATPRKGFVTS